MYPFGMNENLDKLRSDDQKKKKEKRKKGERKKDA